jgi:hypothetical protein
MEATMDASEVEQQERWDRRMERERNAAAETQRLRKALVSVKETIEIVLGGRSVIASMALSGAVDVIDEALKERAPEPSEEPNIDLMDALKAAIKLRGGTIGEPSEEKPKHREGCGTTISCLHGLKYLHCTCGEPSPCSQATTTKEEKP